MVEHILSLMIFLPLVVGFLLLLLPIKPCVTRVVGLLAALLVLVLGVVVFAGYDGSAGLAYREHCSWVPSLGISYHLGVDGISLLILLAVSFLYPLVFLMLPVRSKGYFGCLLLTEAGMLGALCAADIVLFYVFWEFMLLPVFFMIGLYGGAKRLRATLKMTIYTIAGSLCMLAALAYLAVNFHARTGVWSFEIARVTALQVHGSAALLAFAGILFAFAIKIPIFPFHGWLPDAYEEAPTGVTFVLSALMAKIGIYGVIRFVLPVFPEALSQYGLFVAVLAVIGLLYCGLAAFVQKDFKRLLAYSSASHMGLIALGALCLNAQALTGSLFQIVAHATSTGLLFLLVGVIEQRCGSRRIDEFGGLASRMPLLAVLFVIAMLASCGLPGTNGFIGEFLIILGAVKMNMVIGILAALTLLLGVCYMLWLFQRVFLQKRSQTSEAGSDLKISEALIFLPVIVIILWLGIYPQPFLKKITPSVEKQLALMTAQDAAVVASSVSFTLNND